jgi:hypothetical protein
LLTTLGMRQRGHQVGPPNASRACRHDLFAHELARRMARFFNTAVPAIWTIAGLARVFTRCR